MDFDHSDGSTKLKNIADCVDWSEKKILAEAEKCDVVCANCHRIRTFNRELASPRGPRRFPFKEDIIGSNPIASTKSI